MKKTVRTENEKNKSMWTMIVKAVLFFKYYSSLTVFQKTMKFSETDSLLIKVFKELVLTKFYT